MLLGSQLGDRDIRQDLGWRTVKTPCDFVAGVPELGDVRQTATIVDVMDARCAPPRVASRFGADPSVGNQILKLLLRPRPLASFNQPGREPVA